MENRYHVTFHIFFVNIERLPKAPSHDSILARQDLILENTQDETAIELCLPAGSQTLAFLCYDDNVRYQ
jgi:hypothetical protein